MNYEVVHASSTERVDPRVCPDIGPVAPMLAEFKIINMRSVARLVNTDEFVLRAVRGARAAFVFTHTMMFLSSE